MMKWIKKLDRQQRIMIGVAGAVTLGGIASLMFMRKKGAVKKSLPKGPTEAPAGLPQAPAKEPAGSPSEKGAGAASGASPGMSFADKIMTSMQLRHLAQYISAYHPQRFRYTPEEIEVFVVNWSGTTWGKAYEFFNSTIGASSVTDFAKKIEGGADVKSQAENEFAIMAAKMAAEEAWRYFVPEQPKPSIPITLTQEEQDQRYNFTAPDVALRAFADYMFVHHPTAINSPPGDIFNLVSGSTYGQLYEQYNQYVKAKDFGEFIDKVTAYTAVPKTKATSSWWSW